MTVQTAVQGTGRTPGQGRHIQALRDRTRRPDLKCERRRHRPGDNRREIKFSRDNG